LTAIGADPRSNSAAGMATRLMTHQSYSRRRAASVMRPKEARFVV
jgi:hypothetical protein